MNKPNLTIKSENGPETTIVEAAISYIEVFDIREDYVNIIGFTMTGASSSYGIYLYYVEHGLVLNNTFYGNYYGVGLKHSDNNIISNSNAYDNNRFTQFQKILGYPRDLHKDYHKTNEEYTFRDRARRYDYVLSYDKIDNIELQKVLVNSINVENVRDDKGEAISDHRGIKAILKID